MTVKAALLTGTVALITAWFGYVAGFLADGDPGKLGMGLLILAVLLIYLFTSVVGQAQRLNRKLNERPGMAENTASLRPLMLTALATTILGAIVGYFRIVVLLELP
ncbi:hypothetical protein [Tropicibacter sp. S64]|uniref:hypothetical protein n=1 Tax=Tropicibacter sp. S64 TaxID=3415122 RepID=UPI003C7E2E3C